MKILSFVFFSVIVLVNSTITFIFDTQIVLLGSKRFLVPFVLRIIVPLHSNGIVRMVRSEVEYFKGKC
jgi:hypothetical protein